MDTIYHNAIWPRRHRPIILLSFTQPFRGFLFSLFEVKNGDKFYIQYHE